MDFTISDDRRMLADSLARFLAESCDFTRRTDMAFKAPFHDAALWHGLADLGIFHAFLPETANGFGGTGFDVSTVFESLGRALCPAPVLGQLMGLRILMAAGADPTAAFSGDTQLALAVGEPDVPFDPADIQAEAVPSGNDWTITGRKSVVYGGGTATHLLVAARYSGGIGVFSVQPEAAEITAYGMIDGGGAAELMLDASPATCLLEDGKTVLEDALDWGRLALAAEAVGAADRALEILMETLRTRQQFGRPIGQFQVLRHRAVDLTIALEQARSITIRAAAAMATPGQARAVAMAKNLIGRVARTIAEESLQMQGGIALTWEAPASHYAKRLTMIDAQLGDADWNLMRVAGLD